MNFFYLAFTVLTLTTAQAAHITPLPHRDHGFEKDFKTFSMDELGVVLKPTRSELKNNLQVLAAAMAQAATEAREDIDIDRMREITVRIYQTAKIQTKVYAYRREYRLAVFLPPVLLGAFGAALAATHPMDAGLFFGGLATATVGFTAAGILSKKAYLPHQIESNSLSTAFFQPGEMLARGLKPISQKEQTGLMRFFWSTFLVELKNRGHTLDLSPDKQKDIAHLEALVSEKVGLSLNCERFIVGIQE